MVTFDRIPGVDPQLQLSTDWQCHTTHVNGVQCHRLLEKNPYSEVLLPERIFSVGDLVRDVDVAGEPDGDEVAGRDRKRPWPSVTARSA